MAFVPEVGFVGGNKQKSEVVKLLTLPDCDQHNAHILSLVLSLPTVAFHKYIQHNKYYNFKSANTSPLQRSGSQCEHVS